VAPGNEIINREFVKPPHKLVGDKVKSRPLCHHFVSAFGHVFIRLFSQAFSRGGMGLVLVFPGFPWLWHSSSSLRRSTSAHDRPFKRPSTSLVGDKVKSRPLCHHFVSAFGHVFIRLFSQARTWRSDLRLWIGSPEWRLGMKSLIVSL
jgi:hypothetical protein